MDLPPLRALTSEQVPEPVAPPVPRSEQVPEPVVPPVLWLEKPEPAALMEPLLEEMDWQQTPAGKCHRRKRRLVRARL